MFVSYQAAEKLINVEMDDTTQCQGSLNAKICFSPMLVSVIPKYQLNHFKDLNSTVAKRGSVFIGLMTPDGAIWFRYQRAV